MRKRLQFMLFTTIAICLLITAGESKARAQISGEIEADIPFPFYAGNAGFEAGKYTIRPVDSFNNLVFEISSAERASLSIV